MKRIVIAGVAGLVAVGAVSASAASLGGITSESVGVDNAVVATCDSDGIDVDYTVAYSSSISTYEVDDVDLSGVATACNGLSYRLTLSGAAGVSLAEDTGTVSLSGGAMTIDMSSDNVDGEAVTGVALSIVG